MRFCKPRWRSRGNAAAIAALGALGILAAGATGASAKTSTQCSGADITGQGASVMEVAYKDVWGPDFNTSTNAKACNDSQGTKGTPTVKYNKTSSGLGLASWGVTGIPSGVFEGFSTSNAFVVTEEPPNSTEKSEIEGKESTPGSVPDSLLTIPVVQEAIAIIVHLPAECKATSGEYPGRLVLGNETLQEIWLGTINTWSEIKDGGDELTGSGCSSPITRVVREDSAGSTHILKKYLGLINAGEFTTADGQETWNSVSEGPGNTVWPTAAHVVEPAKKGDAEEVEKVAKTAGSIGYASLANARANKAFAPPGGGENQPTFWTPVQNNGLSLTSQTFQDPSTDKETSSTAKSANCAKEAYTNGKGTKFPPKSTADSWSPVTTSTKETSYPLCGIAYELSLTKFSAYPGTSPEEEITDANFLSFVLETKTGGGQELIAEHDYEALPAKLDKESNAGVKKISD